jgi:hypothetical protein
LILPRLVHHAYSKLAEVTVPSLDDWEKEREGKTEKQKAESGKLKLVPVDFGSPLAAIAQMA